jgi:hypothetical protein
LYLQDEYPFSFEKSDEDETFRQALTSALLQQRKNIFVRNCRKGYTFQTFICKRCLTDYLERHLKDAGGSADPARSKLIVQFFANVIHTVKHNPQQHRVWMVERCSFYHFVIQPAGGAHPRALFLGRKPHHYNNVYEQQNLEGFTSDASSVIALFMREADLCRRATDQKIDRDYPRRLIAYIKTLFRKLGKAKGLETALNTIEKRGAQAFF